MPWVILLLVLAAVGGYALSHRNAAGTPSSSSTTTSSSSTPPPTTSTTSTTSTTKTSSTTTTSSPPPTSNTATNTDDPAAALEDLRYAVAMETNDGSIDDQAGPQLTAQMDKIEAAMTAGDNKAAKAVSDFGDLVQHLVQQQHITQAGAAGLADPYNALKTAVGS